MKRLIAMLTLVAAPAYADGPGLIEQGLADPVVAAPAAPECRILFGLLPCHDRGQPCPKGGDKVPPVDDPHDPMMPPEEPPKERQKGNNGLGNGDQTAPGNSLGSNRAENERGNPGHASGKAQNSN